MRSDLRVQPRSVRAFSLFLVLLTAALAHAQNYTSVVVFGDSLSDIGNVADLTAAKYGVRVPGPVADYADGRFTDGAYTVPAAHNFEGVWIEQLAAMLPAKPVLKASLDGGTDYAYGFAKTSGGVGSFTFGPNDALSVSVDNVNKQITTYLGTHPRITDKTLFVVWGGAIDLLYATSTDDVIKAALLEAAGVQRLIDAGATRILVPNLPPLGAIPRLNGSATTSVPATEASVLFNTTLATSLDILQLLNRGRGVDLFRLDIFSLFVKVITSPPTFGFVNVTGVSQGNSTLNPDTYLFWDDLHPTTHGYEIIALTAAKLIGIPPRIW